MFEIIIKLLKFGVVGGTGLVIDFGLTYLFKEKAGINKYVANAIGFSVAATSNFFLNKIWTFRDTSESVVEQFAMFFIIALVGLAINQAILYMLHHYYKRNFYVAKLAATLMVFVWNFVLNYLITFNL